MSAAEEAYTPFPQDHMGNYMVPHGLRQLIWMASGVYYNHHDPTTPNFLDGGENDPDNLLVNFNGDYRMGEQILDTVAVYSQGFLAACAANEPLPMLSTKYRDAVNGIRILGE